MAVALLTVRHGQLSVLLTERTSAREPRWALPEGPIDRSEDGDAAALRQLRAAIGIDVEPWHIEQLRTFTDPPPKGSKRTVTIAYVAFIPNLPTPRPAKEGAGVRFWPVEDLRPGDEPDGQPILAAGHDQILTDAVERARAKLEYTTLATAFLDEPFTIGDLRRVYEAVWGARLHPANFGRKVLSTPDFVQPTGAQSTRGPGRPALLYRAGPATALNPPITRPRSDDDQPG